MTGSEFLSFLVTWGLIGCAAFSVFVVVAFRTGLVYTARKDDGTLKDRIPLQGILAMSILPVGLIGLHLVSNYFGLVKRAIALDYWYLFLINYSVYLVFFIYDTLVIDGFVLAIWRPALLRLSDAIGRGSMRKHILISLPIGLLTGALLSLCSTALSHTLWMN